MSEETKAGPALVSRRNAMKLAAAATGASTGMLFGGTALAQTAGTAASSAVKSAESPKWFRFALGEAVVTVVLDGIRPGDGPHPTFGANQTAEAVAELMRANSLPETRFANGFCPVLIEKGGTLALFDTGMGEGGRANGMGKLVERMAEAGYAPEDVDIVVLTHMHGDHIGGLMEAGKPTFANARYVAGQVEYDFWTDPARAGTPAEGGAKGVLANVKPLAEKITFIGDGADVVTGITSMAAVGHSPGHLIFNVESAGKRLVLTADTANHFVLSLQKPDWEVKFDMDKAAAAASRKKVFDMIATDKVAFLGYHMPFPAVGYAEKLETGYRFVPKSYQFDI
jgi:glyoxylase-like metal-dependent hydrolase (beta-lactamase superfamily II)